MNFQRGTVVRSKAGHDKGSFFVVLETDGDTALISDGSSRPVSAPKRKKLRHLAFTRTVLCEQSLKDNSKICEAIETFRKKAAAF